MQIDNVILLLLYISLCYNPPIWNGILEPFKDGILSKTSYKKTKKFKSNCLQNVLLTFGLNDKYEMIMYAKSLDCISLQSDLGSKKDSLCTATKWGNSFSL